MERVLSHTQVDQWIAELRTGGLSLGFTCGAFDILHAGHVDYLGKARGLCDRLLVAVNSDDSIRRYKDPLRPLNPQEQRMQVVAALRCVDAVTVLDDIRPIHLIERWRPDVYIKGGDYSQSQLRSGAAVEAYGGRVEVCTVAFDVSTTRLLERAAHTALYSKPASVPRSSQPLVLLDRDGTLIRNVPFLRDPNQVMLLPGVGEGLAALQERGLRLALLTNQQGIGLGYFDYAQFVAVNQEMLRQLGPFGVKIARIYYCPHSVADQCSCRKPGTELIRRALHDFEVQPSCCYVIGDSPSDFEAATAAGCHAVLVPENSGGFLEAVRQIGDSSRVESML